MPKTRSNKATRVVVAGVLVLAVFAIGTVILGVGQSVSGFGSRSSGPLVAGCMIALLVLLVLEVRPRSGVSQESESLTCTECGQALVKGSRLCPNCGRLLNSDLALPTEGD